MASAHDDSQRQRAARTIGVSYLVAMATSMFAEGYVRGTLIVPGNAMATAQNIAANALLFRAGVAAEIATFVVDLALIAALYVVLSRVSKPIALFAMLVRVAAECVALMMAADSLTVARTLNGASYLQAFEPEQLAALARLGTIAHDMTYGVVFVILGVGSAVFGWLWVRSGYIPRPLAWLSLGASVLLGAGALAITIQPDVQSVLYPGYMIPMFLWEVGGGLWLLVRGIRLPSR
jgi:hypothetical protein